MAGPDLAILDGFTLLRAATAIRSSTTARSTRSDSTVNNIGVGDLTNVKIVGVTLRYASRSTVLVTTLPASVASTVATCTVADGSFQVQTAGP